MNSEIFSKIKIFPVKETLKPRENRIRLLIKTRDKFTIEDLTDNKLMNAKLEKLSELLKNNGQWKENQRFNNSLIKLNRRDSCLITKEKKKNLKNFGNIMKQNSEIKKTDEFQLTHVFSSDNLKRNKIDELSPIKFKSEEKSLNYFEDSIPNFRSKRLRKISRENGEYNTNKISTNGLLSIKRDKSQTFITQKKLEKTQSFTKLFQSPIQMIQTPSLKKAIKEVNLSRRKKRDNMIINVKKMIEPSNSIIKNNDISKYIKLSTKNSKEYLDEDSKGLFESKIRFSSSDRQRTSENQLRIISACDETLNYSQIFRNKELKKYEKTASVIQDTFRKIRELNNPDDKEINQEIISKLQKDNVFIYGKKTGCYIKNQDRINTLSKRKLK